MTEQSPRGDRRRPSTRRPRASRNNHVGRFVFWLVVLAVIAGGGWLVKTRVLDEAGLAEDFADVDFSEAGSEAPAGDRAVVLVFPEWDATGYVTEERSIPSRDRVGEDILGLMRVLCQGPRISGAVSAFPKGTVAQAAFYDEQEFSVVLDFSQELVTGHPGGATAEQATITSILRTVALNFPQTRSCRILVDGAEVETLAGHVSLDRPFDPRRWL